MRSDRSRFPRFLHHTRLQASSFRFVPVCTELCQPVFTPSVVKLPAKALPALFHADPRRFYLPRPSAQYIRVSSYIVPDACSFRTVQLKPSPESPCGASTKCLGQFERRCLQMLLAKPQQRATATSTDTLYDSPFEASFPSACRRLTFSRDSPFGSSTKSIRDRLDDSESPCGASAFACPATDTPLSLLLRRS